MSLSARTIFVTGASRGLGLEFVKQILMLPSAPEVLFAACRDPSSAKNLQSIADANPSVKIVKMDVDNDEEIQAAYKETAAVLGDRGLNLLINNAGINDKADGGTLSTQIRDRMQRHFNSNSTGPVMVTQKFLPLLQKAASSSDSGTLSCNKAGVIVISSVMGSEQLTLEGNFTNALHYRCSKAAVNMAVVIMANDLGKDGILVAALHPGWVQTDMGGSKAPLVAEDSVAGCLSVIGSAGRDSHAKLINWEGKVLPY